MTKKKFLGWALAVTLVFSQTPFSVLAETIVETDSEGKLYFLSMDFEGDFDGVEGQARLKDGRPDEAEEITWLKNSMNEVKGTDNYTRIDTAGNIGYDINLGQGGLHVISNRLYTKVVDGDVDKGDKVLADMTFSKGVGPTGGAGFKIGMTKVADTTTTADLYGILVNHPIDVSKDYVTSGDANAEVAYASGIVMPVRVTQIAFPEPPAVSFLAENTRSRYRVASVEGTGGTTMNISGLNGAVVAGDSLNKGNWIRLQSRIGFSGNAIGPMVYPYYMVFKDGAFSSQERKAMPTGAMTTPASALIEKYFAVAAIEQLSTHNRGITTTFDNIKIGVQATEYDVVELLELIKDAKALKDPKNNDAIAAAEAVADGVIYDEDGTTMKEWLLTQYEVDQQIPILREILKNAPGPVEPQVPTIEVKSAGTDVTDLKDVTGDITITVTPKETGNLSAVVALYDANGLSSVKIMHDAEVTNIETPITAYTILGDDLKNITRLDVLCWSDLVGVKPLTRATIPRGE